MAAWPWRPANWCQRRAFGAPSLQHVQVGRRFAACRRFGSDSNSGSIFQPAFALMVPPGPAFLSRWRRVGSSWRLGPLMERRRCHGCWRLCWQPWRYSRSNYAHALGARSATLQRSARRVQLASWLAWLAAFGRVESASWRAGPSWSSVESRVASLCGPPSRLNSAKLRGRVLGPSCAEPKHARAELSRPGEAKAAASQLETRVAPRARRADCRRICGSTRRPASAIQSWPGRAQRLSPALAAMSRQH